MTSPWYNRFPLLFGLLMTSMFIGARGSFARRTTQDAFVGCRRSSRSLQAQRQRRVRHPQTSTSFSSTSRLYSSSRPWSNSLPVGIIFDMDGTLVKPCIDFADMRQRIYTVASHDLLQNVSEGCVLELAGNLSQEGKRRAKEVFDDIESRAIQDMAFMDGMEELCRFLDSQGIRRALLTRNVERSVAAFHNKMGRQAPPFDPAVARDSLDIAGNEIPPKPQPHAIEYICQEWSCDVSEVVMVGDSAKDDVVSANRAGCSSVLLQAYGEDNCSGNDGGSHPEERTPTVVVSSLRELHEMLLASVASDALTANATK